MYLVDRVPHLIKRIGSDHAVGLVESIGELDVGVEFGALHEEDVDC